MAAEQNEGVADDLLVAIQRLGRLMGSRQVSTRIAEAADAEISQQGVQILRSLLRHGELPIAGVAAAAHMDISAVSRQLRPLEEAGLVGRALSPQDGRVALVALTPQGRTVAERIRKVGLRHLEASLRGWTKSDQKQLAQLMSKLVDDMQHTSIEPTDG
ncbi:MAG: MarR family transcriptional regulator [Actinobacteria bacterium]|nr:MarR family transcriptional regulator [Actinomycetota bacterium]